MDKVLVVGDSHAIALADGAKTLGLKTGMAFLSGNDWHSGLVRFHRKLGCVARGRPGFQKRLRDACEQLGSDSLLNGDHAILMSVGYQLGRLVSPIRRDGHGIAGVSAGDTTPLVSPGLVAATVHAKRRGQFNLVRRLSRQRQVIVVAPPVLEHSAEAGLVRDIIGAALREAGATLMDPRDFLPDGGVLFADHRHEDGVHGNAAYGQLVLERLLAEAPAVTA